MGNSGSKGGKPEDGGASAGGGSAPSASGAAGDGAGAVESKKTCLADFVLLKTVGKGSFGKVMLVRKNDTEKVYAMKVLNKERVIARKQYDHTLSERKILEDIDHPFLVGLHFAFQSQTKLYMVFDFFNGGELYYYISKGRFTEDRARFYAAEICLGLGHLHKHNIVYRDLKPENLLLDADGHIKICDFGLSKQGVESDEVKSICGTPEYLAPEVIQHKSYVKQSAGDRSPCAVPRAAFGAARAVEAARSSA
jgi:protein-serine/threonine kinase